MFSLTFDIFNLNKKPEPKRTIKEDLEDIKKQLDSVKSRFEMQSDSDLVDACIYEINSLQAHYNYLLKLAKQKENFDSKAAGL